MSSPDDVTRWDLALVPGRRGMRVAPNGVKALVRFLRAFGVVDRLTEATDDAGVVTIAGVPGEYAHALFHEGESTGVTPAYRELRLRFGSTPLPLDFPEQEHPAFFALEVDGAAFDRLTEEVKGRVDSILYVRPTLLKREAR